MSIEIYDEETPAKPAPVRVKLEPDGVGKVLLVAVGKDGSRQARGTILSIKPDGTISLYPGVEVEGLNTDENGYITVAKY